MTFERLALGRAAEAAAASWYEANGYQVIARNWRCAVGEIDLVAVRSADRLVAVCEVKARSSARFGSALEAVDDRKQRRVRRVAGCFLTEAGLRARRIRFDVAAWQAGTLVVVEGAF